ncbi:hypothetical protein Lal_00005308 [Lupinus albus]|nr:hypothetical protein Lal_00005308 [Lupinus albus]
MTPLRLVFMGTPDFAVPSLAALIEAGHQLVCVYSQPPRPAGRGQQVQKSPVHRFAEDHGIPVRTPKSLRTAEAQAEFADLKADAAVVAAYGLILPQPVLDAPRLGCVNVHGSLLPRWRGAAPIQRSILAGDAETGITIMQMDIGLDTGAMLSREAVAITAATTASSLHDDLAALGARMIVPALDGLAAGTLAAVPQPEDGVTYAAKLTREDGRLDWTRPASFVERQVRALTPWPGCWFDAANGSGRRTRLRNRHARHPAGRPADGRLRRWGRKARQGAASGQGAGGWCGFPARLRTGGRAAGLCRIRGGLIAVQRWKLTVEYDGRPFVGWQRQDNGPSVQQSLEEAVQRLSGEVVRVHGSGRTDAGVHALGQVCHFDLEKPFTGLKLRDALNFHLKPAPIAVLEVEAVTEEFHARLTSTGRAYVYRIVNRRAPLALDSGRAWHVTRPLNAEAMHDAAQVLVGQHDFSSFRAALCQAKSPVKTLDRLAVERQGEEIRVHAAARSFLHHQVRNMVGTLELVGAGKWTVDDVRRALDARDRAKAGPTCPPDGLYFMSARY